MKLCFPKEILKPFKSGKMRVTTFSEFRIFLKGDLYFFLVVVCSVHLLPNKTKYQLVSFVLVPNQNKCYVVIGGLGQNKWGQMKLSHLVPTQIAFVNWFTGPNQNGPNDILPFGTKPKQMAFGNWLARPNQIKCCPLVQNQSKQHLLK